MTGLTTVSGSTIATNNVVVAQNAGNAIAAGHTPVDQNGAAFGVTGNPIIVSDAASGDAIATVATQTTAVAAAAGTTADAIYSGSGTGTLVSLLKWIGGALHGTLTEQDSTAEASLGALGTTADAAWGGTGNSSVVAALKAIWTALTTAVTTKPKAVTYSALTGTLTLATGATAQALQTAGSAATLTIYNPATAAQQGIGTAESIFVNAVGTASIGAGSNNIEVLPGATFILGPTAAAVSWIAATAGHKISGHAAA